MKNTVVLFHPRTGHERNYRHYWIPYSLLSVARPLGPAGFRVVLWDSNALGLRSPGEYRRLLEEVIDDTVGVGVSSMIGHQIRDGLLFSQAVRDLRDDVVVAWGGAFPTVLPEVALSSPLVDVVVRGQGEATFVALVARLREGKDWNSETGISFRTAGGVVHNPPREMVDMGGLPKYPWGLIDAGAYVRADEHISPRVLNYVSSLGCPYDCAFCSDPAMFSRHWTALTPERVMDDLRCLVETHQLSGIKFYDSTFFAAPARSRKFAGLLLESGLGIAWAASSHPKAILKMTDKDLDTLARSGLARVLVGLESGVQRELDLVGKGPALTVADLYRVAGRLSHFDIRGSFTFIVGFPGSSVADIDATLRFGETLREADPRHEVKMHIYFPYPGTGLYSLAQAHGYVPPVSLAEWSVSDYYEAQTPWVPAGTAEKVRKFNETHCPYV